MAYSFFFNKKADKQFAKLDKTVQKQILDYLEKNIEGTERPRDSGKPLTGDRSGFWRYRIGKYRLIVDIQDERLIVLGIAVGNRNDIYKR